MTVSRYYHCNGCGAEVLTAPDREAEGWIEIEQRWLRSLPSDPSMVLVTHWCPTCGAPRMIGPTVRDATDAELEAALAPVYEYSETSRYPDTPPPPPPPPKDRA